MREYVCVAKDAGAVSAVLPIARAARSSGNKVRVVSEGLATQAFSDLGFTPDFEGVIDFTRGEEPKLDVRRYLESLDAAVLVVGESSPANLERRFVFEAAQLGVPVVECQDFWGGHCRLGNQCPTLLLTPDQYGRELAIRDLNLAPEQAVVVGHVGARMITVSPKVEEALRGIKESSDRAFYFAGAGSATAAELELMIECVDRTPGTSVVVVGFHPRRVAEYGKVWRAILNRAPFQVVIAEKGKGDEWAASLPTISGFSTQLVTAVYNGQAAISLKTPGTMATLYRQSQLKEVPLVALGCAHAVTEPTDLSRFVAEAACEKIFPYNVEIAWNAVSNASF